MIKLKLQSKCNASTYLYKKRNNDQKHVIWHLLVYDHTILHLKRAQAVRKSICFGEWGIDVIFAMCDSYVIVAATESADSKRKQTFIV